VVKVGTSKISGCTISLQATVHPGASATGTQHYNKKGKTIHVQAYSGTEVYMRLRLPDLMKIGI
jgi:hypothetical protein